MPKQTAAPHSNTAEAILDAAELLIQTRGYSAISYQHIADRLGIRKASIHYHFPSKSDLGAAAVQRYSDRFEEFLTTLAADQTRSAVDLFAGYTAPYITFAETPDRICLCGALAGEIGALPAPIRDLVEEKYRLQHDWLTRMVKRGVAGGEFTIGRITAPKMASTILSALQGALIIKRATGNATQLRDVIAVLKASLTQA